ncbi:hypothetical protein MKW94_022681, partial [Papaver nudicaule]|nr:hypothetical protein [Papaver nudicaule]
ESDEEEDDDDDDDDLFTVPDMDQAAAPARPSSTDAATLTKTTSTAVGEESQQNNNTAASGKQRKRGRNPADREYRRLKRVGLRERIREQSISQSCESLKARAAHTNEFIFPVTCVIWETRTSTLVAAD